MNTPTISWSNGCVKIIDQTRLPSKLVCLYCRDIKSLWEAIKVLRVRGAPALGAAAAFGVVLGVQKYSGKDSTSFIKKVFEVAKYIGTSRPTAVNLFNSLNRMKQVAVAHSSLSEYPA